MMLPARTCWPPNFLTPRRWAFESRPLRVEPAPFLDAKSWRSKRNIAAIPYQRAAPPSTTPSADAGREKRAAAPVPVRGDTLAYGQVLDHPSVQRRLVVNGDCRKQPMHDRDAAAVHGGDDALHALRAAWIGVPVR